MVELKKNAEKHHLYNAVNLLIFLIVCEKFNAATTFRHDDDDDDGKFFQPKRQETRKKNS